MRGPYIYGADLTDNADYIIAKTPTSTVICLLAWGFNGTLSAQIGYIAP